MDEKFPVYEKSKNRYTGLTGVAIHIGSLSMTRRRIVLSGPEGNSLKGERAIGETDTPRRSGYLWEVEL
jgi:hypothetical protein